MKRRNGICLHEFQYYGFCTDFADCLSILQSLLLYFCFIPVYFTYVRRQNFPLRNYVLS